VSSKGPAETRDTGSEKTTAPRVIRLKARLGGPRDRVMSTFARSNRLDAIDQAWVPQPRARWLKRLSRIYRPIYENRILLLQSGHQKNLFVSALAHLRAPRGNKSAIYRRSVKVHLLNALAAAGLDAVKLSIRRLITFVFGLAVAAASPLVLFGASGKSILIALLAIVAVCIFFLAINGLEFLRDRPYSSLVMRIVSALLIGLGGWSALQLSNNRAAATNLSSSLQIAGLVACLSAASIVILDYIWSFVLAHKRVTGPESILVQQLCLWWLRLIHTSYDHPFDWDSDNARGAALQSLKEAERSLLHWLPLVLTSNGGRSSKQSAREAARLRSAKIRSLQDCLYRQNGRKELMEASQLYLWNANARTWLELPTLENSSEQRRKIRPLIAAVVPLAIMTGLHFSPLLSSQVENWGWIVAAAYLAVTVITLIDPDFERRLTVMSKSLSLLGKKAPHDGDGSE
jgi:hypothetical protein